MIPFVLYELAAGSFLKIVMLEEAEHRMIKVNEVATIASSGQPGTGRTFKSLHLQQAAHLDLQHAGALHSGNIHLS